MGAGIRTGSREERHLTRETGYGMMISIQQGGGDEDDEMDL